MQAAGEAGQRYAKPDAMPAVALRSLTHALICNHISHTNGRHVHKREGADRQACPLPVAVSMFFASAPFTLFLSASAAPSSCRPWSDLAPDLF